MRHSGERTESRLVYDAMNSPRRCREGGRALTTARAGDEPAPSRAISFQLATRPAIVNSAAPATGARILKVCTDTYRVLMCLVAYELPRSTAGSPGAAFIDTSRCQYSFSASCKLTTVLISGAFRSNKRPTGRVKARQMGRTYRSGRHGDGQHISQTGIPGTSAIERLHLFGSVCRCVPARTWHANDLLQKSRPLTHTSVSRLHIASVARLLMG